jgi:hypothetical protein
MRVAPSPPLCFGNWMGTQSGDKSGLILFAEPVVTSSPQSKMIK